MPKRIALGIVLFNNSVEELRRLLRSVAVSQLPADVQQELLWWDNSATDHLRAEVGQPIGALKYWWTGANVGFAISHNRLMEVAFSANDCSWYVCVNPDGILHPQCVSELVRVAQREPRAGLVEARLFPDEHPKPYDPLTLETPWCTGCVLLITRALFERIGGFDENFFMYCEDVDLSWRARTAGFQTLIAPAALVHHHAQGRQTLRERELAVRRSAAYLGYKYGATEFSDRMLGEYESLGGQPFELPKPAVFPRRAKPDDFQHLTKFSEPRW